MSILCHRKEGVKGRSGNCKKLLNHSYLLSTKFCSGSYRKQLHLILPYAIQYLGSKRPPLLSKQMQADMAGIFFTSYHRLIDLLRLLYIRMPELKV